MLRNSETKLANVTVTLTEAELASFYKTSSTKQDKKPEAACTKDYYEFIHITGRSSAW